MPLRHMVPVLVLALAAGCDAAEDPAPEAEALEVDEPEGAATPNHPNHTVDHRDHGDVIHIGGHDGVHVGEDQRLTGVGVGGDQGFVVGDHEAVEGVRIGGKEGVMIGRDAETKGVRIGGRKGVEVGEKGVSIGGRKIIGNK
jgi:hypothetical protein